MNDHPLLRPCQYYHVYNRGINGEDLFREERNYRYFLEKYAQYIEPVAETYAYCLLGNHFHLLVRIRDVEREVLTGLQNLSGRRPDASPTCQRGRDHAAAAPEPIAAVW